MDVRDVVEIDAAERLHPQVFAAADGRGAELRVADAGGLVFDVLKSPADECGEAASFVLLNAQAIQMLDAIFERFDVAEHHRAARIQPQLVRDVHDLQPRVGFAFQRSDAVAHRVHEDFAAAAGDAAESGVLEFRDDLAQRHLEYFGKMLKLWRAETVDIDVRIFRADVRKHVEIPLDAELRMVPALQQNLHAADGGEFVELLIQLLAREHIVVVVFLRAVERAELAIHVADVRVVDVAVHDVGDDFVAASVVMIGVDELAPGVRQFAEFGQRQAIKFARVFDGDALSGENASGECVVENGCGAHASDTIAAQSSRVQREQDRHVKMSVGTSRLAFLERTRRSRA